MIGVNLFDVHLPVVAIRKKADGGLESPKPLVYGTAFPIFPGLLMTAAHVYKGAKADGIPALGMMGQDYSFKVSEITEADVFDSIDLALLVCPSFNTVTPIPLDFSYRLGLLDPVWTVGFPAALDAEWVSVVPRAFRGTIVTRRENYQLPAQPPCYEVSFPAPEGLSGAPLMSPVLSRAKPLTHRCYGYVIQHATLGTPERQIAVGLAVDITALLAIETNLLGIGSIATAFGHKRTKFNPTPVKLPGGMKPADIDTDGWPDDKP